MEPEQLEIELLQGQTPRRRVETWRGKPINAMTREEAIQALTECATAYRDNGNDLSKTLIHLTSQLNDHQLAFTKPL